MHSLAAFAEWTSLVLLGDVRGAEDGAGAMASLKIELASQDMKRVLGNVRISHFWLFWWRSRQVYFVFFPSIKCGQKIRTSGWWHNLKSERMTISIWGLTRFHESPVTASQRQPVQCLSHGDLRKHLKRSCLIGNARFTLKMCWKEKTVWKLERKQENNSKLFA